MFYLNARKMYVMVNPHSTLQSTALVLAAPFQRRDELIKLNHFSQCRWRVSSVERLSMSPHSCTRLVKYHRPKARWAMSCMAALLCLATMLPLAAQAQTLLPVIIKLPPSFLQSAPASKLGASAQEGVMKATLGAPVGAMSQIAALRHAEVRAAQLHGLLPHQADYHFFGLEATERGGAFAVTLVVEPASLLESDAVNFVVLTENGMEKFLAGVDPVTVKTAMGSPLLFDSVGNRLTALVPGSLDANYTVVVFNNGKLPASYTLQVLGGELVDNGGQSISALKVGAPVAATPAVIVSPLANVGAARAEEKAAATLAEYEGIVKRLGIAAPIESVSVKAVSVLQQLRPEPVRARQVSGALMNEQERHYLNLATDLGDGELTLTLRYEQTTGAPTHLNFWVMTQDGVRHLIQGGLPQELNLATGLPVAGKPGVYEARLRMAPNMLYTVVVFSEGALEADYTLAVQGGILVDRYGQTREAHAAEMELLALASN